jgi:hypothetical protein
MVWGWRLVCSDSKPESVPSGRPCRDVLSKAQSGSRVHPLYGDDAGLSAAHGSRKGKRPTNRRRMAPQAIEKTQSATQNGASPLAELKRTGRETRQGPREQLPTSLLPREPRPEPAALIPRRSRAARAPKDAPGGEASAAPSARSIRRALQSSFEAAARRLRTRPARLARLLQEWPQPGSGVANVADSE